jgi:hypothetical protein
VSSDSNTTLTITPEARWVSSDSNTTLTITPEAQWVPSDSNTTLTITPEVSGCQVTVILLLPLHQRPVGVK